MHVLKRTIFQSLNLNYMEVKLSFAYKRFWSCMFEYALNGCLVPIVLHIEMWRCQKANTPKRIIYLLKNVIAPLSSDKKHYSRRQGNHEEIRNYNVVLTVHPKFTLFCGAIRQARIVTWPTLMTRSSQGLLLV